MKHRLQILALLALSLAGTAQATSSVTATLSNFQLSTTGTVHPYALGYYNNATYDFEWGTMQAYGQAETGVPLVLASGELSWRSEQYEDNQTIIDATQGETPASWATAPASSLSSGATHAHAHVNQDLSLVASVSTGAGGGYAVATAGFTQSFWLAANSSITLTWDTHLTGSNSGENYVLSHLNSATSAAGAKMLQDPAMQHYTIAEGTPASPLGDFSFEKGDTTRTLTFTTTDTASHISFRVEAFVETYDHVSAVPEPETWAMALIGLAVVGANARRRLKR
jgi:hypothetical protein